jgi:hypothetical protein
MAVGSATDHPSPAARVADSSIPCAFLSVRIGARGSPVSTRDFGLTSIIVRPLSVGEVARESKVVIDLVKRITSRA